MPQNIAEVFSNFSQKFARFSEAKDAKRVKSLEEEKKTYYEEKMRERGEKLLASVVATYKIYKSPFEALGEGSERAASIDHDEQNLLKAYNLYKSCMEIDKENQDEIGATHIKSVEIFSPLAEKAVYTQGGQFVYLMAWLYFEQNQQEYFPFFDENENHHTLQFAPPAQFQFDVHEKEIFEIIKREFYS